MSEVDVLEALMRDTIALDAACDALHADVIKAMTEPGGEAERERLLAVCQDYRRDVRTLRERLDKMERDRPTADLP